MALSNSFFEQVYLNDFPRWNHGVCPVIKYNAEDLIECQVQKNDKQWKKKQLIFIDQYIICHYNDNSIKWLSIENSNFKLVQNAKEPVPTFIFQQRENTLKIQGNIISCLKNLKRYIIQNDFKHRYQFQKKLGQGSFADVYQVREKATDNIYAVKMFDKLVLEQNENNINALLKEIQILRILKHDSTINLIECYESQSFIYLIMEQLKGGNLGEYLEKNAPLSEKHTAHLIYHLLQSLKYIHGCGIIHRDLKPENIIFREKNNLESLCIADFGLADFYNTEGKYLFTRCGSVGFVAPEILRDKNYDYKVDLFSIGIIMYCAITKKQPFEGNSLQKVQKNYVGEIDFSIINLSENGLEFLKLILKPNPLYRIALPETLTNSWFVAQNIINLKGSVVKKKSIMSSSNLSTPNLSESSCSSPRSPSSVKHNNSQSLLLKQSTIKKMSNFKLDKIDSFQSPKRLEQSIKQSKAADKQLVRKSIFKQLEPIKKVTEI